MYTYSRNNDTKSENYLRCRISYFKIPDVNITEVHLENKDIIDSFDINCSALYMQGACINDNVLYIGQGITEPMLRIVDLNEKQLKVTYNLKEYDYGYEPEGCFWHEGNLYLSSSKHIHSVTFD